MTTPVDGTLSMKERMRAKFAAKQAERAAQQKAGRASRRYDALQRHARMVYDTDRDVAGEFSAEDGGAA